MKKLTTLLCTAAIFFAGCRPVQELPAKMDDKNTMKSGVLRIVAAIAPQVLGYPPEMGPQDVTFSFPAMEPLMTYTDRRTLEPFLCTKVDTDAAAPSFTFHLRKGIMFHDGSELTAEVARWNFQQVVDTRKLQFYEKIKAVEIIDPYTFRVSLKEFNNQLIYSFGSVYMASKKAFQEHGKDWVRTNCIGTGPFQLAEFKRDEKLKWVRFNGYWRKNKGLPHLDGVEVRFIPDPVTASSILETKQGDLWIGPSSLYQRKMVDRGYMRQSGHSGLHMMLIPNYLRADGKWKNKRLREALEHAIDRVALTKAFGFGFSTPMTLVCPSGEWGYDPNLARLYDPARSRQLIREAGYREPVKVKILSDPSGRNTAGGIKGFLDAAGFDCEIDIADSGRYFGSIYENGWEDLCFTSTGVDANSLITLSRWFGPEAKGFAGFVRPPVLTDMFYEALTQNTVEHQEAIAKKIVKYMHDEALICPLYKFPVAGVMQPYVHTGYLREGMLNWDVAEDWMARP